MNKICLSQKNKQDFKVFNAPSINSDKLFNNCKIGHLYNHKFFLVIIKGKVKLNFHVMMSINYFLCQFSFKKY